MNEMTQALLKGTIDILKTSDLHMSVGEIPKYRRGIELVPLPKWEQPIDEEMMEMIINDLTAGIPSTYKGDWDTAAVFNGRRLRLSVYRQMGHLSLAIRIITNSLKSLSELGVPNAMQRIVDNERMGLILICGATGSGKSTTLSAAIDRINATRHTHIITIEDPVEYVHTSKLSTIHQREIGPDTESFSTAIRAAMRQDPDVIMVGEMRDMETMEAAVTAAETGHLVMATVHAMDVASAINRIVGVFPANQQPQIRLQLSGTLKLVMVQRLLPKKYAPEEKLLVPEILVMNPANVIMGSSRPVRTLSCESTHSVRSSE